MLAREPNLGLHIGQLRSQTPHKPEVALCLLSRCCGWPGGSICNRQILGCNQETLQPLGLDGAIEGLIV